MHLSGDGQEAIGYKDKKEFTRETKRRTVAVAISSMLVMIGEGGTGSGERRKSVVEVWGARP